MEAADGKGHATERFIGEAQLESYIRQCTNWHRWGPDDELGALNLVTPETVQHALTIPTRGKVISMTLPYDGSGPQQGGFRSNPTSVFTATGTDHIAGFQEEIGTWGPAKGFGFADDMIVMPTQAGTQWDALSHIFWRGQMYNGYSASEVGATGARRNGVHKWADSFVMRGVLLDVARYHGMDSLEPGHAISADELEATAVHQAVDIRPGDLLVIRTGFLEARRRSWGDYAGGSAPGLSLHSTPWLRQQDVAAIATDTWGVEVRPNEIDLFQPLHIVALVHMGLALGEMWDLEAVANDCDTDGKYEFLFVGPPLPITGAVGSPLNALAIK